jgi:hypothetical protein
MTRPKQGYGKDSGPVAAMVGINEGGLSASVARSGGRPRVPRISDRPNPQFELRFRRIQGERAHQ